ncbi:phage tail protein, partial [Photorhabdus kleinii]|uniref:phage tail protein n=1 Tax=Photorhabdus kleinii TaxID=768034 RepID=UPI0021D4DBDD
VAAGIAPTILDAGWFNTVQRELINAIMGAGIKLDSKNDSQLFVAIKKLIDNSAVEIHDASLTQKGITQLTDKTGNSNTLAATQKLVSDVNDNANSKLAKNQNGADIPDKNAFVKNLGLVETVELARNSAQQSFVDANFARGNIGVVNTRSIYPLINFLPPAGKENRGFFAIEANLTNDNEQSIYLYKRNAAGNNIYLVNFPNKNGTLATLDDIVPVGVPLPYPHRYTPAGYLTCNGQTFDKSKYPKLAEAYPSGQLLDLRGEFIRGWDDSRGVDPGRMPGTWQGDAIQDHNHYKVASKQNVEDLILAGNQSWSTGKGSTYTRSLDQNTYTGGVTEAAANETRPRNVAFNYIVRAA